MCGSFYPRVIREPEIVIRRKHYDFAAADHHIATLFAFERDFVLEGLCFFDILKLVIQCGVEFTRVHSVTPLQFRSAQLIEQEPGPRGSPQLPQGPTVGPGSNPRCPLPRLNTDSCFSSVVLLHEGHSRTV